MKKVLFLAILTAIILSSCKCNRDEKQETDTYVNSAFVFDGLDTIVDGFAYVKYIPIGQVTSESKIVTADYVRYHDSDTTGIVFTKDYIRNLCLSSRCVYHELQDSIYGLVREIYFPEAYLGFAYDKWEEVLVYSFIDFADYLWFSDVSSDGITVTSDVETALWDLLPNAIDSIQASANIYRFDEKTGIEFDHAKDVYLNIWDITRKFYNHPTFDGVKYDSIVVYSNDVGLTFVKSIESNHLTSVLFAGYHIEDSTSLSKIEYCFIDKLNEIPVRDDVFVEPYEKP